VIGFIAIVRHIDFWCFAIALKFNVRVPIENTVYLHIRFILRVP